MERNKWEIAIRCLEVALHPNTSDDEVIAGVNGFRRTAAGMPLGDICRALAATEERDRHRNVDAVRWRAKLDRLNRENIQLRLRLEAEQRDAAQRLGEAERRVRDLTDDVTAARFRADEAERQLGDFRDAYRDVLERANRSASEPVNPATVDRPARPVVGPFQTVLATARQRGDAEPAPAYAAIPPQRRPSASPAAGTTSRAPWTA